ncbi:MAG TPA: hypothetical protein H9898_10205 [Candidatus Anaerobiospirillum stercoravium]|nr:hypothetical protein [Candidatus Anaerobiospirillum stercoravium]
MASLLNVSTKVKILGGFVAIILINIVIVAISINVLNQAQSAAATIDSTLNGAFKRVFRVQNTFQQANLHFARGLNERDTLYTVLDLQRYAPQALNNMQQAVDGLQVNFINNQTYQTAATNVKAQGAAIVRELQQNFMPLIQSGQTNDEALAVYTRDIVPRFSSLLDSIGELTKVQTDLCTTVSARASDRSAFYLVVGLAGVVVLASIGISLFIAHYITKQVLDAIHLIEFMAKGDFTHESHNHIKDEFGRMHGAINEMRQHVNNILIMTQEQCAALKSELEKLRDASQAIVSSSDAVQNQSMTVAAASDQMVSTTQDIARNCETAASGSNHSRDITVHGLEMVKRAFDNVQLQVEHTRDNSNQIEELTQQSQAISVIVNTIEDIADQTNLLALNASIEAARAGDAGRGFAVVADEVRSLAIKTAQSTKEIAAMVTSIQATARKANGSITTSVQNMATVADDAKELEQMLNQIAGQVGDVNQQITQIATSTEEQTKATEEISMNAANVNNAASEMTMQANSQHESIDNALIKLTELVKALSFFQTKA